MIIDYTIATLTVIIDYIAIVEVDCNRMQGTRACLDTLQLRQNTKPAFRPRLLALFRLGSNYTAIVITEYPAIVFTDYTCNFLDLLGPPLC